MPYLLIDRYDRTIHNSEIARIHQEDFCQALGIAPQKKYQNEGGPSLAQCFELLSKYSTQPAKDRLRMADAVIFNYLIGNTDAHGKNFSFLHEGDGLILAPFYDLLSTVIYPNLSQKMAMKIGGKYKYEEVHLKEWEKMATETGLGQPYIRARLIHIATQLPKQAKELIEELKVQSLYSSVNEIIYKLISKNADKILRIIPTNPIV